MWREEFYIWQVVFHSEACCLIGHACVRGSVRSSPIIPLVGNICTIGTNLLMAPLVKKLVQIVKTVMPIDRAPNTRHIVVS